MVNTKLQLVAVGRQDIHLIGNPQISYFKSVYKRHTNFMIQKRRVDFDNTPSYNSTNTATLLSYGDLLYDMALVTTFDGLSVEAGYKTSYANAIGHSLIKSVAFKLGGYIIDTQTGDWLNIWKELTTKESQKQNYNKMIGQNPINGYHTYIGDASGNYDRNFDASGNKDVGERTIITPFQFWFCKKSHNAVPTIALKNHQIEIELITRPSTELYVTRDNGYTTFNSVTPTSMTINDMYILCDYIFLDEVERNNFVHKNHDYLITQIQTYEENVPQASGTQVTSSTISFNFNNPVTELFWVVQRSDVSDYNEWFNYSNTLLYLNKNSTSIGAPIKTAKILFNSQDRTLELYENIYRRYETLRYHTSAPESYIYTYSFSLNPENTKQPSGTANLSKINSSQLYLTYNMDAGVDIKVKVFAINYNILRIRNGMGGILYQN